MTGILQRIVDAPPGSLAITPEWLCLRHGELAGELFPDWAGRFRDRDVQVGGRIAPPFYEVPVLVRLFCDDLAVRLQHIGGATGRYVELLAWADWRFQWIHPFRDFNGRIGRVTLVALLHFLGLPPVDTAPIQPEKRRQYLNALHAADQGDLALLTAVWFNRLMTAL